MSQEGIKVLLRSSDNKKNSHIAFQITYTGHVLVVETNDITDTNPVSNNPSYNIYNSFEEYVDDFVDSIYDDLSMITIIDEEIVNLIIANKMKKVNYNEK